MCTRIAAVRRWIDADDVRPDLVEDEQSARSWVDRDPTRGLDAERADVDAARRAHIEGAADLRDCEENRRLHEQQQARSEEHTSELQSRPHLVCRLLLEKK